MVNGTTIYSNLNKKDLYESVREIITNETLVQYIENAYIEIPITIITRAQVQLIVDYLANKSYVPAGADLTPIVDKIDSILCEKNTSINKELIKTVFKENIDSTNAYEGIDMSQSAISINEERKKIDLLQFIKIDNTIKYEEFCNLSEENVVKIVNAVNQQTGLNYDINLVLIKLNFEVKEEINSNNLNLAIKEILRDLDLVDANGDMVYQSQLDAVLGSMYVTELSDTIINSVLSKFIEVVDDPLLNVLDLNNAINAKLDSLDIAEATVWNDMVIDLTPSEYHTGATNLEQTDVHLTINEAQFDNYITIVDDKHISLQVKDVMQTINAEDILIKSYLKSNNFKVSINGGAKYNFEKDDAWKVLTNDGKDYKWEYVETFFKDGPGNFKIVENLKAMDAIPDRYLSNGMIIYVQSTGVYYSLIDKDKKQWDVLLKNDLSGRKVSREVLFKNVKLGHGDSGSDLRLSQLGIILIDSPSEFAFLDEYIKYNVPNLISFKNVGYRPALIVIDDQKAVINPNSVFETPFDVTMNIKLLGTFNLVLAYIAFEVFAEEMCTMNLPKDLPKSLVNPYF